MANKKRGLKKLRERADERRSLRTNPPIGQDLLYEIGPAFGAYAATRFGARIASKLGGAKLGKHAAPLGSVSIAAAAWLLAHRIPKIAKFHTPIIIGSSIAAVQSLVQTYLPQYGWLVGDIAPEAPQVAAPAAQGGLGDWNRPRRRKKRRMKPVGDEFDNLEQEAQQRADAASGGAGVMDDESDRPIDPASTPIMPEEWEIDAGAMDDDDFGSLAGGLSN